MEYTTHFDAMGCEPTVYSQISANFPDLVVHFPQPIEIPHVDGRRKKAA